MDIIDPDKLKALREIKDSKFPELKALRDERSRLQELVKTMLLDLDQQRSLLNRTFLDKDAAQTSLLAAKDALRAAEGPRKDSAQIRLNIAAPDMDAWYALEKRLLEGQERAALSRADLVKDVEVIESLLESEFGLYDERPDPTIKRAIETAAAKDFLAYTEAESDDRGTAGTASSRAGSEVDYSDGSQGISPPRTPGIIRERRRSTELMSYLISTGSTNSRRRSYKSSTRE